jgi:anti-sigma factor RsiW
MRCGKCKSLYTAYRDGDLRAAVKTRIENHLGECPDCRSVYDGIEKVVGTTASLERFAVADDLAQRILSRIRSSELVPSAPKFRLNWVAPRLAYGFAVMLITGLVTLFSVYVHTRNAGIPVAQVAQTERVYSLGPELEPVEMIVQRPAYSLGQTSSSPRVVYSLPTHAGQTKLTSY